MNWYAETNFAVTIAGGSIGGLCAGIALRGIGADVHIYEQVAGPMETSAAPELLSKATSYICFANTTHLTCR